MLRGVDVVKVVKDSGVFRDLPVVTRVLGCGYQRGKVLYPRVRRFLFTFRNNIPVRVTILLTSLKVLRAPTRLVPFFKLSVGLHEPAVHHLE